MKRTEIHGDRGSARVEQDDLTLWEFQEKVPSDNEVYAAMAGQTGFKAGASDPRGITHIGHRDQLIDFLQAIDTGRDPAVDGREGRKSVEIIRAIYRSAETANGRHAATRRRPRPAERACQRSDSHGPLESRRRWLDYLVYLAVRLAGRVRPDAYRSSSRMRWRGSWDGCFITVDTRHRQVGLDNLAKRMATGLSDERDQIVRGVYRHFCMMLDGDPAHSRQDSMAPNWRDRLGLGRASRR